MTVAREIVVKGYQLILGRYPESEEVIEDHMRHENIKTLRASLLSCTEFRRALMAETAAYTRVSLALPRNEVETEASDEMIERCLEKISSAWTHLGKEKPHFSVLTEDAYTPANLRGSIDNFWHSGEVEKTQILSILHRHGFERLTDKTCVELGCGVGRVTFPLAMEFAKVHAYDISAPHLAVAAERSQHVKGSNEIVWHECARSRVTTFEPCDFFYSRIVLQHNPPIIISRLIENALMSLKKGGVAIFQVPTYRLGYSFRTEEWLAIDHPVDMQMHCLPQKKVFEIVARSGCVALEIREDDCAPPISNTFVVAR
jgi:SAM-dependent methyltransferase